MQSTMRFIVQRNMLAVPRRGLACSAPRADMKHTASPGDSYAAPGEDAGQAPSASSSGNKDTSEVEKKKMLSGGLPDEVPTDNKPTNWTSHANRPQDSKVPHFIQEVAPEAVERALPESIHPTEGKPKKV